MPLPLPPTIEVQKALLAQLRSARIHAESLRQEAADIRAPAWSDFLNAVFH